MSSTSPELIEAELRAVGYEPLEPCPGFRTHPVLLRCATCGYRTTISLSQALSNGPCRHRIRSSEKIAAELRKAGYLLLGSLPQNRRAAITVRCATCGALRRVRLRHLAEGKRCRHSYVSPGAAAKEMRAAGYRPSVPYPGNAGVPWPCVCAHCGKDRRPELTDVRAGKRCGCQTASRRRTALSRTPPEQVDAELRAAGYVPLENCPSGTSTPVKVQCSFCGGKRSVRLKNVREGRLCKHNRITADAFKSELLAAGYTPLQPCPDGGQELVLARCDQCGIKRRVNIHDLRVNGPCAHRVVRGLKRLLQDRSGDSAQDN